DAAAGVAVERLHHHRVADPGCHRHRLVVGAYDLAAGNRQAGGGEQRGGQLLIAGDVDAQGRGARRHGGPDALLVFALAELDEGLVVQTDVRNVSTGRLVEDRLGRWPEGGSVGEQDEVLQLGDEVERRIGLHQVVEQAD